jgi:hypothetical protein
LPGSSAALLCAPPSSSSFSASRRFCGWPSRCELAAIILEAASMLQSSLQSNLRLRRD